MAYNWMYFFLFTDRQACLFSCLIFCSLTTTLSTIIINSTYRIFLVVRYFLYMVSSASLLFLKSKRKKKEQANLQISFKNSEQLCSSSS